MSAPLVWTTSLNVTIIGASIQVPEDLQASEIAYDKNSDALITTGTIIVGSLSGTITTAGSVSIAGQPISVTGTLDTTVLGGTIGVQDKTAASFAFIQSSATIKASPGTLLSVILSGVTNSSLLLLNNSATIAILNATAGNTSTSSFTERGIVFSTLTASLVTGTINATVIYL